jgi:uncharacterized repeat protein (TIGR02543 family)
MNALRLRTVPAVLFLALLLAGCKDVFHSGESNTDGPDINGPGNDGKTRVCFVNSNDFSVAVYSDASRLNKFIDVEAGAESGAVETEPNPGAVFYVSYRILIDNQEFPYNSELHARIDAEKTTMVPIPLLSELEAAEFAKPVTDRVHVKIQNAGTSTLVLRRGTSEQIPQGADSAVINGGETAYYEAEGGPVSNYSFMKNTVTPLAFPAGLADFVPGRLYSFKFDGNALTLLADKPLTVAEALEIQAPENISAKSLADGRISLTWDRVGMETGYVIYRSESQTGTYMSIGKVDATSYTDVTVAVGNIYYYRISAVKNNVESGKSNTVVSIRAEIGSLSPPQGLRVAGQAGNSISLAWQTVSNAGSYKVYKGSNSDAVNEYVAETASASYTVTDLAADMGYYFTVSAVHESVESLPSVVVQGKTSLASPQGLRVAGQTENSISLSWQTVSGAGRYKVYKGSSSDAVNEYVAETPSASYTVTGLAAETSYYFTVSAVYGSGESPPSAAVQGKISDQYTVTFNADGGSPAVQTRTVMSGAPLGSSNMPSAPAKAGYVFGGWYTAAGGGGGEFTAGTPVTGNITVYARWNSDTSIQYTVTFDAAGGSPAVQTRMVTNGAPLGSSNMPSAPTKAAYIFDGWYTRSNGGGGEFTAATPVTGDITVYAWWKMPDTLSLADALTWISSNAVEGGAYTITLRNNETIPPKPLSYGGKTVNVILTGGTTERTIGLSTPGSLFAVGSGVTLTMDNNVTLVGRGDNTASLVRVDSGGTLVMNAGSKTSGNGNTSSSYSGGGVSVKGTFTMKGGTISGNTSSASGGGVYVNGGTFTMDGGTISGNTCSSGGGVYAGGTFTMNGGTISGNTCSSGGGVYTGGTFIMNGGTISENTSSSSSSSYYSSSGGGVFVNGIFIMNGGTISGNTSSSSSSSSSSYYSYYSSSGGGVFVNVGTFTMNGGTISGNTSSSYSSSSSSSSGGGVCAFGGIFTMSGGTISGNTSSSSSSGGGGVYVSGGFTKQPGGIIYGSNESDSNLRNTATSGSDYGHAVYVASSPAKKRNFTAGQYITLDSTKPGTDGGWE